MTDHLELDLTRSADAFHIPPGDVDAVVGRARHRTRRRRAALSGMTAVAFIAGAVGVGLISRDDRGTPVVVGGAVGQIGDVGVSWAKVDAKSALGFMAVVDAQAPLYALSTAPGQVDLQSKNQPEINRVVYRSEDGVDWQSVSELKDDLYLSDLSRHAERIYAVGTGPATVVVPGRRGVSQLMAGWSDDGGKTWQKAALPVDLRAMAAKTTMTGVRATEVAAGAKGTVAVAVLHAEVDVPKVLPPGATAPHGWAITPTGVDVLGAGDGDPCPPGTSQGEKPQPVVDERGQPTRVYSVWCFDGAEDQQPVEVTAQDAYGVVKSYTWADLNVDGDLLLAVRSRPVVFVAAPGTTAFERVELPETDDVSGTLVLQADDTGFDLLMTTVKSAMSSKPDFGVTALRSPDGRAWSPGGPVQSGLAWFAGSGRLGDGRTALVGDGDGGPTLLRADGAGGWTPTNLASVVPQQDGMRPSIASAGVGPLGVVAVVAMVPDERLVDKRMRESEAPPTYHLLVSRDGTTWQTHPLDQLAGAKVGGVHRVLVTGDRAIVSLSLNMEGGPGPKVTLVGVPD